jgi:hypothetical protein
MAARAVAAEGMSGLHNLVMNFVPNLVDFVGSLLDDEVGG